MIAGGFGIAWTVWGASGLTGGAAVIVRIGGIVVGALILVAGALQVRRARRGEREAGPPHGSGSIFSSSSFRLVTAVEVIALIAGGALLGAVGQSADTIARVAAAVGGHLFVFGGLFWTGFYWLGAAMLAAGIAGAIVGVAGASSGAIRAVSGLISAASLFAAGGWAVLGAGTRGA